ncbi:MAG: hypothetical protein JXM79_05230 [Sedimentisphaerales bacterium]|nr:hypothetical protein [Sedimentisphaerales bacterium]
MGDFRDIQKRGGDKIGLLGLFVLAVIAAYLTVALKSAIKLSEPIPLPHTGLSISMPVGNGWHSERRWMYHESTFILSSIFAAQPERATGWAHCYYRWAAKKAAPEDRFAWKASDVDGEIVETGRTPTNGLTVDWVRIERPDFLLTTFWGTAELPNGRQLDIEVHQVFSDPELSKRIFNRILENLSFDGDPLIEAGANVVTAVKSKGLDRHLNDKDQRTLYLIKDPAGQPIGFTVDFLMNSEREVPMNVKGASFLYIDGPKGGEQEVSFECSNNLEEFKYRSRVKSAEEGFTTQVVRDESGTLTVRKRGQQSETKKYYPGPSALPDVFFDHLFRWMLDNNQREMVVDIVEAAGKVVPTYISRSETENSETAYVFDLEFHDDQGLSHRVFLDEQKRIYKSIIQREIIYVSERTTAEEIVKAFPDRAPQVLRDNQKL